MGHVLLIPKQELSCPGVKPSPGPTPAFRNDPQGTGPAGYQLPRKQQRHKGAAHSLPGWGGELQM